MATFHTLCERHASNEHIHDNSSASALSPRTLTLAKAVTMTTDAHNVIRKKLCTFFIQEIVISCQIMLDTSTIEPCMCMNMKNLCC